MSRELVASVKGLLESNLLSTGQIAAQLHVGAGSVSNNKARIATR